MLSTATRIQLGFVTVTLATGASTKAYIREYDYSTLNARTMVDGTLADFHWNGARWIEVQATPEPEAEVQEMSPASAIEKPVRKPAFISRKALVTKLQAMNPSEVLYNGYRRQTSVSGYRGHSVEQVLRKLIGVETFSQATHVTKRGNVVANPKWFKQLFTDLEWTNGDITPGMILQALA